MDPDGGAPYYGAGRDEWERRYNLKSADNIATGLSDLEASGTRVAIAWVNNNNDPKADHFILIYKNNLDKWVNWDHTRTDFNWHGDNTKWYQAHRLIYYSLETK